MLTIRLQRAGKKNKADYRIVLAEKTAASQKKFTEIMGSYNPHTKVLGIRNPERLKYWMEEQHVEVSATVHNILVTKEIIKDKKVKSFTIPKKEVAAEEAVPAAEGSTDVDAPAEATPVEEAVPQEAEATATAEEPTPIEPVAEEAKPESVEEPSKEEQAA